jgi:hypothetical protein
MTRFREVQRTPWFPGVQLTIDVTDQEIVLHHRLLRRRRIPLGDVLAHEVVTYRPIRDYGGYGIKYSFRLGWAYNVKGNRGVRLQIKDKKPLLIGSRRPEELAEAIQNARAA